MSTGARVGVVVVVLLSAAGVFAFGYGVGFVAGRMAMAREALVWMCRESCSPREYVFSDGKCGCVEASR